MEETPEETEKYNAYLLQIKKDMAELNHGIDAFKAFIEAEKENVPEDLLCKWKTMVVENLYMLQVLQEHIKTL